MGKNKTVNVFSEGEGDRHDEPHHTWSFAHTSWMTDGGINLLCTPCQYLNSGNVEEKDFEAWGCGGDRRTDRAITINPEACG